MGNAAGLARRHGVMAILILLGALVPLVVAARVFPDGSPNVDELGYLSQADALRHGQLTLSADSHDPNFRPFLSGVHDDRVVFKYQPAWPALIAASEVVTGRPGGALAVAGAASVLAMYAYAWEVCRRRRVALLASTVFVVSPFWVVQSGTNLAHQLSATLVLGATAALLRGVRTGSSRWLVASGLLFGAAVFHRPFDAVLMGLPALAWLLLRTPPEPVAETHRDGGSLRRVRGDAGTPPEVVAETHRDGGKLRRVRGQVGWVALGAVPFAMLFLAYDWAVTGNPLVPAFSVSGPLDVFGFGERSSFMVAGQEGTYDFTPGEAVRAAGAFAGSLLDWLPGGALLLVLAVWGLVAIRRRARTALVVAQLVVLPVGYLTWWGAANAWSYSLQDLLGPFYWFPALGPLAVLAAEGIDELVDRVTATRPVRGRGRVRTGLAGGVVVVLVAASSGTASDTRDDLGLARKNSAAEARAYGPEPGATERSLVVASPKFVGDPYAPAQVPADLDAADHLTALDPDFGASRFELIDRFPERTVFDVVAIHPPDEPFTGDTLLRRRLSVRSGPRVDLRATTLSGEAPTVQVGSAPPVRITAPTSPTASFGPRLVAPDARGADGPDVVVVPSGPAVRVSLVVGKYELWWTAQVIDTADGAHVRVIDPPTPVHRYEFDDSDATFVIERIDHVLRPVP